MAKEDGNTIFRIWKEHSDIKFEFINFLRTMPTSDMPGIAEQLVAEIQSCIDRHITEDDIIIERLSMIWRQEVLSQKSNQGHFVNSIKNRTMNRVQSITDSFPPGFKPLRIMDFGCGSGDILVALGKQLQLGSDAIIGIDIVKPQSTDGFHFSFLDEIDPANFLRVNMIYSLVVFHHLSNPREILGSLKSLMYPGDLFLLREHNCTSPDLGDYFDLLHRLWLEVFFPGRQMVNAANYHPISFWDQLFADSGFTLERDLDHLSVNFTEFRLYRLTV